jgi:mannosyltransferase OCH1-like enzyme
MIEIKIIKIILLILIILLFIYLSYFNYKIEYLPNGIPKIIYLSYKTKNIPNYIIPNIEKIYKNYIIKLYDNNDCIKFLKEHYNDEYVDIFNFLKDGPIKADFWRLCILYKFGGFYFDIDCEHIKNITHIDDFKNNDISLVTIYTKKDNALNPAILISKKNNPIIKECIDVYINKYRNKDTYSYWGYSIVGIMTSVLFSKIKISNEGIYTDNNNKYLFLSEQVPSIKEAYVEYKNIKLLNARYNNYNDSSHNWV